MKRFQMWKAGFCPGSSLAMALWDALPALRQRKAFQLLLDLSVFSNPGMSLKGVSEAGSFGRLLFGILSYMLRRCRRGGGNVG
ncbi:MAG: hypothetical protein WCF54_10650, partial [Terracidiphilus sp.]